MVVAAVVVVVIAVPVAAARARALLSLSEVYELHCGDGSDARLAGDGVTVTAPGPDCTLRVGLRNDGRLAADVGRLRIGLAGSGSGAALRLQSARLPEDGSELTLLPEGGLGLADGIDVALDVARRVPAGGTLLVDLTFRFPDHRSVPTICHADGATVTVPVVSSADVTALRLPGTRTFTPTDTTLAVVGSRATSCDR